MLEESSDQRRTASYPLVRRLIADYMKPHLGRIVLAILCMALAAGATAALAKLMEPIINDVFTARDATMLVPISMAVLAVFLAKGMGTYGQAVLMSDVGRRIIAELQAQMFGRLMHADVAAFHDVASGKLVSRFTYDVQQLYNALSGGITGIGKDALTVVALAVVMVQIDAKLSLIALIVFPIALVPIVRLGRRIREITRRTQSEVGELNAQLNQVFQGIRHVKAYNAEARETVRSKEIIGKIARLSQKAARVKAASHPIMEVLGGVAIVGVILYGGSQVIGGSRTPGSFFAFITALLLAYEPLKKLANLNANLQMGLAAAERVFAMLDSRPSIVDAPTAKPLILTEGRVELRDVHFAYGADTPALHGITLEAPAGRTVALVGPSGAGKSTVLNLIPRFYDVTGGSVLIDGQDLRDVTLRSLRDHIALVSQEVTLFDDTVAANIAYSRPDAAPSDIEEAARNAAAHDFIDRLPQGYATLIGENGVKLSGGQRQRLSIARAMLKNAPILLLDEATSALDTESERLVQEALQRLMKGRTTLVIAHRLSTVTSADHIYVLDRGKIAESGSHAALVVRGGTYARLWALQTGSEPANFALGG